MKLSKLYLNNFRIFRGEYEFDFNCSKLVIVYGQNGNGKSTIFDAIEWCITGELQRYRGSNEKNKFHYIINSNEYKKPVAETNVQLDCVQDGILHTIKRVMKENTNTGRKEAFVIIDNIKYKETEGNKKIQSILIKNQGVNEGIGTDNLLNFKDLFSATQLLSQNELNDFVLVRKPQERFKVMETILGVEKYGETFREYINSIEKYIEEIINKGNDSIKQLEVKKNKQSEILLEIRTKIEEKEKHFSNIGSGSENEIITSIIDKLGKYYTKFDLGMDKSEQINKSMQQKIKDIKKRNEEMIAYNKNVKLQLSRIEPIINFDIDNITETKKIVENQLNIITKKYNKRDKNIDKYTYLTDELKKIKEYKSQYNEILKQIGDTEIELNDLTIKESETISNIYISSIKDKFEDLDKFIQIYNKYNNRIIVINKLLLLNEKANNLTIIKNEIKEYTAKLEKAIKENEWITLEASKYEKIIKDISGKLNEIKDDNNKQLVYNIQQYLIKDATNGICPVCGTDFKLHIKLVDTINKQIEEATKSMDVLEKEHIKAISIKSRYDVDIKNLEKMVNDLKFAVERKESVKTELEISIEELRTQLNQEDIILSQEELINEKQENNSFIQQYRVHYEFIQKLKNIQNDKSNLVVQINQKYSRTQSIEDILGTNKGYLKKSTDSIDNKIFRLDKYIALLKQSLKEMNEQKKKHELSFKEIILKINRYKEEISNIKQIIPQFLGNKEDYLKWSEQFTLKISELENVDIQIQELLRKIDEYLSRQDVIELKQLYNVRNIEFISFEHELQKYLEIINTYKSHIGEIENVKVKSKEIQSTLISSFMDKYSTVIDRLFFQITPHAFASHVYLIPRNGNLYIIISDKSGIRDELLRLSDDELAKEINASLTLSSAQSNILAVCIFMVMNMSQKWSELDLMGIDDPFQNMDDINVFSFIDTLSGILGEKQVIISTHSSEFANLILNKAPMSENDVSFVQLNSYCADGVEYEMR